jgi:acyl-CoA thioesterase
MTPSPKGRPIDARRRGQPAPAWGIEIEEAREGYARIRMILRADMLNGHGIAHGGIVFSLADTAFAYACNSRT